ncbi:MAG: adenylate/guanylate cyclase domain-containing protein [Geminicoccales bacterium]
MSESFSPSLSRPEIPGFTAPPPHAPDNRHAQQALERHKREGMELAVKVRTVAMIVVIVMLFFISPWPLFLYYQGLCLLFILNGLAQQRVAKVGRSRVELALILVDIVLMVFTALVPSPFNREVWPSPVPYEFQTYIYFFVILATATLAYTWRTIVAFGVWTALIWMLAAIVIWLIREPDPQITRVLDALYAETPRLRELFDPTLMKWDLRIQEVVVILMVAGTLAVSVRRLNALVLSQAQFARERANLARYFSPNVVEQLSHNDEPLKQVKMHDVAVMFVDIVGFTRYASSRNPGEVIATLRDFHARIEAEVFRHSGTLDKYLGDGLMATFGTPVASPNDAKNAVAAARAMLKSVDAWNAERRALGQEEVRASIGLDFGPVVLGDIGANRLEFAVIGNTVNMASRIEAMTRVLDARIAASDALISRAAGEQSPEDPDFADLVRLDDQEVRGFDQKIAVWCLPRKQSS